MKEIDLVGVGDVAVRQTFCAEGKMYVCLIYYKIIGVFITVHKSLKQGSL